CQQCDSVPWTF
nr:immunoglobulin light chain junction region [Macaca mulatta]